MASRFDITGAGEISYGVKTILIVLLVVIVLGVGIFFLGRYIGKKNVEEGNKGVSPEKTDWGKQLTDEESEQAKRHAQALYEDMKGLNVKSRNMKIYSDYLATSDRVFIATANHFNDQYGEEGNLAEWIDDENFFLTNLIDGPKIASSIIERLAKFGIVIK